MKRRYVANMQQYCSKDRVKGAVVKPSVNVVEQFLFRKNIVFRNSSNPAIKTPEQNYNPELLSRNDAGASTTLISPDMRLFGCYPVILALYSRRAEQLIYVC